MSLKQDPAFLPGFRSHVITTGAASLAIAVTNLLLYRMANDAFGPEGFSLYALTRRVVSFAVPIAMLGIGVALSRQLSFAGAKGAPSPRTYVVAGASVVLAMSTLMLAIAAVIPAFWALVLFGSSDQRPLFIAATVATVALSTQGVLYAAFRGLLRIHLANLTYLLGYCVIPLSVFVADPSNLSRFFLWSAGAIWGYSVLGLATVTLSSGEPPRRVGAAARDLLRVGIPRLPGDVALMFLFSVVPLFALHVDGLASSGVVAFGISLLSMTTTATSPLGMVLLPHSARAFAAGRQEELRKLLRRVLFWGSSTGVAMAIVLLAAAPRLLDFFAGGHNDQDVALFQLLVLAVPAFSVFTLMRSPVDALFRGGENTRNVFLALATFAVSSLGALVVANQLIWLIACFDVSLLILAWLTLRSVNVGLLQTAER